MSFWWIFISFYIELSTIYSEKFWIKLRRRVHKYEIQGTRIEISSKPWMQLYTILFYSLYDYKKLRALRNGFARHFLPTLHSRAKLHKQKINSSPVISGDWYLDYYTCFRFGGFGTFLRLKINRKNVILSFKGRHFYNLIHALDRWKYVEKQLI